MSHEHEVRRMVVVVTGGRTYADKARVWRVLDEVNPTLVAEGGAGGADYLAHTWALACPKPACRFPAAWECSGAYAGPQRNQWMLETVRPDLVIAFPGGRGTADCVRRARRMGIPVREEVEE